MESDIYPTSVFQGKVVGPNTKSNVNTRVRGSLNIHGQTNEMIVEGDMKRTEDIVNIKAAFSIRLEDYNIDIPSIMMYNIAEEIAIKINIELKEIK